MSKPVPLAVVTHFAWQNRVSEESAAQALNGHGSFVEKWAGPVLQLDGVFARCQSPVERLFAMGVLTLTELDLVRSQGALCSFWDGKLRIEPESQPAAVEQDGVTLHPDFALRLSGDVSSLVYVEIDGHEFHASTRQQVARDRQRERAILGGGNVVIRFTGGEVNASPVKCAREAIRIARKIGAKEEAA